MITLEEYAVQLVDELADEEPFYEEDFGAQFCRFCGVSPLRDGTLPHLGTCLWFRATLNKAARGAHTNGDGSIETCRNCGGTHPTQEC